jgi:hypothetical protein
MSGCTRRVLLEEPTAGNLNVGVWEGDIPVVPWWTETGMKLETADTAIENLQAIGPPLLGESRGFANHSIPTNPITFRFAPASSSATQVFLTEIVTRAKQCLITDLYLLELPPPSEPKVRYSGFHLEPKLQVLAQCSPVPSGSDRGWYAQSGPANSTCRAFGTWTFLASCQLPCALLQVCG